MAKEKSNRRTFLKTTALVGGTGLIASQMPWLLNWKREHGYLSPAESYELANPENIIYSACQQCNGQCGIKVKIQNGVAVKIDGNPFSPFTMYPHLPYAASPFQTAAVDGAICPKGQAGIQTSYDPYRIRKVLKRSGPRGSGHWVSIPFSQAIDEIVNGGKLFSNVAGEEKRVVDGLKKIWVLRDTAVAKAMAADVDAILGEKDAQKKAEKVLRFKETHAAYLHTLINPDHPDLGPKNNQLAFVWGRLKDGRGNFIKRFALDAFGSVNAHGHTTVCQGSLYFTGKAMSEQYDFDEKAGKAKWTGGQKFFWQADQQSSEFIIFVGVNPFEASQSPPLRARRVVEGLADGRLKYVVIDPHLSRTASKAWKWLANKPGTEAAVALALIRRIIENGRYDEQYLRNANKAAAEADHEPTWSNAAWLVKIEKGKPGKFLRGSDIGIAPFAKTAKNKKSGKEIAYTLDPFIVMLNGVAVPVDPTSAKIPAEGDLFVDTAFGELYAKSSLQILKEEAFSRTMREWAKISGVSVRALEEIADEFTRHGKRAAADIHRGVSQHTNGLYNCSAWFNLNLLMGNYDWRGGMSAGSAYDGSGAKEGQPYPLGDLHPGKIPAFGIPMIRSGYKYEDSTLFRGYPAKRQWYPLASDIYQEIIPSAGDRHPYPIKAMILYMGTPVYSLPAGHTNIEILADPKKIPLVIASDITVGETSLYADYIFPDLTYLERWEFGGTHPSVVWKQQPIRQPAVASPNEIVKVFGEAMPISVEALMLAIAEKLGLPGFGRGGFGEAGDLRRPEDLYLKMTANVAFGHKNDGSDAVPDAHSKELSLFQKSRRHLPSSVYDAQKWQKAVAPELWRKVVYVLNRGGRYDDHHKAYEGDLLKNRYNKQINMYQEKTFDAKNAFTGEHYKGYANYSPAPTDLAGRPIHDAGFDLRLITHREITHTKSRTAANYWLLGLNPDGVFIISRSDAKRLGLQDGDMARIMSATNPEGVWRLTNGREKPMQGTVRVIDGIRPGVISFSLGMGHWAYGSSDMVIDGVTIPGDARRGKGVHANAAMRTDPRIANMCLTDPVGASAVFYDTNVRLVKV